MTSLCLPFEIFVQWHQQPTPPSPALSPWGAGYPHSFLPRTRCSDDEKGARLISFRWYCPYSRRPERRDTAKKKLFDVLRVFSAPILHYVLAPFAPALSKRTSKICLLSQPFVNISRHAQHLRDSQRWYVLHCIMRFFIVVAIVNAMPFVSFKVVE